MEKRYLHIFTFETIIIVLRKLLFLEIDLSHFNFLKIPNGNFPCVNFFPTFGNFPIVKFPKSVTTFYLSFFPSGNLPNVKFFPNVRFHKWLILNIKNSLVVISKM